MLKRYNKKIVIIILILILQLFWLSPVNATENGLEKTTEVKEDISNYSEAYKEYLKLSDEEKSKLSVIPRKYNIPLDSIYEDTVTVKESPSLFNLFGLFSKNIVTSSYSENIPESFDLRKEINIATKNQGSYNLCWGFASTRCLETNLALNGYGEHDLSEWYIDYISSEELGSDGGYLNGGGAFERWKNCVYINGIVSEETVPLGKVYSEAEYSYLKQLDSEAFLIETIDFPDIYKAETNYTDEELNLFRQKVKEHIMKNGSIYAAINSSSIRYSYDTEYATLYCTEKTLGDHAVSIIGWDDNFSRKNFLDDNGNMPQNDGAYIAINSWGKLREIIYISYDDFVVEMMMSGVKSSTTNKNDIEIGEANFKDIDAYNYLILKIKRAILSMDEENLSIKYLKNAEKANLKLNLDNKEITDFSGFNNFTVLNLSARNIKLNSIETLSKQKGIKYLDLSDNEIEDITALEKFDLFQLSLNNNKIKNIDVLSNQKKLKSLFLAENQIEDITALKNVNNLYELLLDDNKIRNIEILSSQKELEHLSINNNEIEDITALSNLTKLTSLGLANNRIEDITALSNLTKLTSLILLTNQITDIGPLKELGRLNYLILSNNQIEDITALSNLKQIETLFLSNNRIEDITPLSNLKNLNDLGVESNEIIKEVQATKNEETVVEVPEIIKQAGDIESAVYSDSGFTLENCTWKEEPNSIIIDTGKDEDATLIINSGKAIYTRFIVKKTELEKNIVNITIKEGTEESFKRTYVKGEELDLNGGVITVTYADGSTEDIEMTNSEIAVSGYDKDKVGTQRVTLTYKEFTVSFNIKVKNDIVSIAIKNTPELIYILRSELDLTGGVITVTYEDGSTEDIEMTNSEVVVGGYNKNKLGNQTLTVFYKNSTIDFNVMVKNDVEHIAITNLPKTKYIKGEELDLENIEFRVAFESGDTLEGYLKNLEGVVISGYDKNLLGTQTITVEYKEKTTQFEITVVNEVKEIKIIEYPKTTYIKGEEFDLTNGKILITYEDGSTEEKLMTEQGISWGLYMKDQLGTQTITVEYKGKSTQFDITVKNDIVKIEIKTAPELIYTKGTELDLTNGIITATYEDESSEDIEMTDDEVSVTGYDKDKMGSQTLIITYKDKTTEFNVMVKNDVTEIIITELPKTTYIKGEEFDLTDGKILVTYEDGSSETIRMTDKGVSWGLYEKDKLGKQTITVEYKGKSTQFDITVKNDLVEIAIEKLPKETYIKGEELDLTDGKITARYEDGTEESIDMTNSEVTVTGYDKNRIDVQFLIVTYKEKTTDFNVRVKNDVTEVTIIEKPKTTYIKGEEFDLTGGKILIKYEDGSSEEKLMTDQCVSWGLYIKDQLGEQTITVEYRGKSAEYTITVIEEFSINFGEYEIKEEENVSYIQNILSNTTKKDLIESIETNGVIEIYKDTEKIENEDTKLATGMELRITHNNVQKTYKIVVLGDITGDGIIDQLDLLMFARYKAGFEEEVEKVKGANLLATDIVKNNNVAEDIDLLKLARILVELDTF